MTNILESIFLFPNEVVGNTLYKGVEKVYEDTEELYHMFIGIVIALITTFIITRALKFAVGTSKFTYRAFVLLPLLVLFGLLNYKNPYNVVNRFPRASIIYNIMFLFSIGVLFNIKNNIYPTSSSRPIGISDPLEVFTKLGISFLFIMFILGIILFITWAFTSVELFHQAIDKILLLSIALVGLTIGYIIIKKKFFTGKFDKTNTSLLEKIVFYIPCLLINFTDYVKEQNKITTSTVWILFACEILFIGLYYLLPIVFNYFTTKDATILLTDPVYLNNKHTLGNFENLHKRNTEIKKDGENPFSYKYSISGWYYINPQPPNTSPAYNKYTPIFNYGKKPLIEYNGSLNKIRIQTDIGNNDMRIAYETEKIQYQKWTNFVINYDGSDMDVFINGELVGTQENVAPFMKYENVIAGTTEGIHGGICNIKYHTRPLTKKMIKNSYNLLKLYNPPVL